MVKNCLWLGMLILMVTSFTLRAPTHPEGDLVPDASQDSGEGSVESLTEGEYPFLNKGLDYTSGSVQEWEVSRNLPEDLRGVTIKVTKESELYNRFGYFAHMYWVQGELTPQKLRLMEYDLLTRVTLRELNVAVIILDFLPEDRLLGFGRRLHYGWQLLQSMKYPKRVSVIHQRYLKATEAAGGYLAGLPNRTMIYRAISETGIGGVRAYGYNAYSNTKLIYETTHELMVLLEGNSIRPY